MKRITQNSISPYYKSPLPLAFLPTFFGWCKMQEKNRLGWLAISLAAHGCIITPLVMLVIGITGNDLTLWITGMAAMGMILIVNLAAMPTKITIPAFFLSIMIDLGIVVAGVLQSATM